MKKVILLGATSNISKYLIPPTCPESMLNSLLLVKLLDGFISTPPNRRLLSRTAIGIIPLILRRQSRVKISFTWQRGISPPPIKMLSMR